MTGMIMTEARLAAARELVRHLNAIGRHAAEAEEILEPLVASMSISPQRAYWEEILAATRLIIEKLTESVESMRDE